MIKNNYFYIVFVNVDSIDVSIFGFLIWRIGCFFLSVWFIVELEERGGVLGFRVYWGFLEFLVLGNVYNLDILGEVKVVWRVIG